MTFDALAGVLVVPAVAAALLAVLPGYRVSARFNVAATTLTLICALSLFFRRPPPGPYLLVDDLNGTFIVLTTSSASPPACSAPATSATSSRPGG